VRNVLLIALLIQSLVTAAQTDEEKITSTLKAFHEALVKGNTVSLNQQTDKALSYGHSNGWVENKNDLLKNLETGYSKYFSIREDSISVQLNGNMANVRFVGDYTVALKGGTPVTYHLKVLEVWVRKGKRWILFARQAVRPPTP
jgi:hypothetical protein